MQIADFKKKQNRMLLLISAGLVIATVIAYEPIRHNDFVSYDDERYIINNPNVKEGLTQQSIIWAFTKSITLEYWIPLTWLSHMLDCQLFGPNAVGHHLVSVTFHIVNALLLFWILINLTGSICASAFVAAVFALHPLQVESVAWVAERKTVLSGMFWFLTIAVYVWYTKKPGILRYIPVFIIYSLCIMTKPVVVTLPIVLILLDYWPLERIGGRKTEDGRRRTQDGGQKTENGGRQKVSLGLLLIEKIPLVALAGLLSVITFIEQKQSAGSIATLAQIALKPRIGNMFISYIRYTGKMIWPSKLAVLYPHIPRDFHWDTAIVCAALFTVITIFFIFMAIRRRRRHLLSGWLWFAGTLTPVIGLVQSGAQSMANRYMYIPMLGLLIIVGWAAKDIVSDNRRRKIIAAVLATTVLAAAVILTRIQVKHWQNNITLFKYTLAVTEKNDIAEGNYGCSLLAAGYLQEAETHMRNAYTINPKDSMNRYNLGNVLLEQGKNNEAVFYFKSISSGSDELMSHVYAGLGTAYLRLSKYEPAKENLTKAMKLQPNNLFILNNVAWLLATAPQITAEDANKAIDLAERACELTGYKNAMILDTLAAAYAAAGRFEEAVITTQKAIEAAKTAGQEDFIIKLQEQIKLYQSGQRYRQSRKTEDR